MSVIAEFSIPVTALPFGACLRADIDVTLELERVVPTKSGSQYLWVVGDDFERAIDALGEVAPVESAETLDRLPDRALVRVRPSRPDTPLTDIVNESGATVTEAVGTAEGWTVSVRLPDDSALATFVDASRRRGIEPDLRDVHREATDDDDGYGMSAVQRETVETALASGYFDVPRRTTLAAIAEELSVSEQAVSERLRRGLANYLTAALASVTDDSNAETSE